jgi:hypothetical protein
MFKRKASSSSKHLPGIPCPYCEYENDIGAEECVQCYYHLSKSARMQPVSNASTPNDEILDILLSDGLDEEDHDVAVEAVLTMDDMVVDVDQYAIVDTDEDEAEEFSFLPAQGPTLTETVESAPYVDEELTKDDLPSEVVQFEIDSLDPLEQVPEPVHSGRGYLFSPDVSESVDEDLTEIMQPPVQQEEPEQPLIQPNLTGSENINVPNLDDLDFDTLDLDTPSIVDEHQEPVETTPQVIEESMTAEHVDRTATSEEHEKESVPDLNQESAAPPVEATPRIWPWAAAEPWDDTTVVREVVTIMEAIQHGKFDVAAQLLDTLGPHLTVNLDVLHHICVALQYINRVEHSKWVAEMASRVYPDHPSTIEVKTLILGGQ